jgi:DNA-binding CsgD family transcriptional regulator
MENLLEIIKGRHPPGILIVDWRERLLYSNGEAVALLPCLKPETGDRRRLPRIPEEILNLCRRLKQNALPPEGTAASPKIETDCALMLDGEKRHFSLRALLIEGYGRNSGEPHIMLLLEKVTEQRQIDCDRVRKEFQLTGREMEVVMQVCQGFSNQAIADNLFISPHTVKDHLKKIMEKMGVESRSEIVALLK